MSQQAVYAAIGVRGYRHRSIRLGEGSVIVRLHRVLRSVSNFLSPIAYLVVCGSIIASIVAMFVGASERTLLCLSAMLFGGLLVGAGLPALEGLGIIAPKARDMLVKSPISLKIWYVIMLTATVIGIALGLVPLVSIIFRLLP